MRRLLLTLTTATALSSACKTNVKPETELRAERQEKAQTRFAAKSFIGFLESCQSQETPEDLRHTIQKLLEVVGEKDCNLAWPKLQSLRQLDLSSHEIQNIAPLWQLTQLEELTLSLNQIEDISPLTRLNRLRELFLGDNVIQDIEPLTGLQSLRTLDLGKNRLTNIDALVGLPQLEWLDLSENAIEDILPLSGLKQLWFLSLASNKIADITALQGLKKLEELYLQNNLVKDLSALSQVPQLIGLDASQNPLGQSVQKAASNCPSNQSTATALREFCSQ